MSTRKKLNNDILSIRDFPEGVEGILGELVKMTRQDGSSVQGSFGQDLYFLELKELKSEKVNRFWADGGLRGTLKMSKVLPNTAIALVHTGEKKIDSGTVQTYDIFEIV